MSNEISCEGCEGSSQCVSFVSFDSFARQLFFLRIAQHCPAVSAESRCSPSGYIDPSTSARVRLREKPVFPGSDSLVGGARSLNAYCRLNAEHNCVARLPLNLPEANTRCVASAPPTAVLNTSSVSTAMEMAIGTIAATF